jgi:hypothetical protein
MDNLHTPDHTSSILYMLGQLTAKVDTLLTTQIITNDRHEALETRVSVLEKDKANIIGGALVVSLLVGLGFDYFLK